MKRYSNFGWLILFVMQACALAAIDPFDSITVRTILDRIGWERVPVDSVVPQATAFLNSAGSRVTTLNLSYRGTLMPAPMTSLPSEISQLPELRTLTLRGNALAALPDTLSSLRLLSRIDLSANRFARLPEPLKGLALQGLTINHNLLDNLPAWIGTLSKLQSLSLVANRLTALPPEAAKLQSLATLNLDSNLIAALPAELAGCANLRISIVANRLCDADTTLAKWLDTHHFTADWRASQQCDVTIGSVVTDAATGTVVHVTVSELKVVENCQPVQLAAVSAGASAAITGRTIVKAVEVRFGECFTAGNNYFLITFPWDDVAQSVNAASGLSIYFASGGAGEYLGGTVDSVRHTVAVRANREGQYLLTATPPTALGAVMSANRGAESPPVRISVRGGMVFAQVSLRQASPVRIRLFASDGRLLHQSIFRRGAGTQTLSVSAAGLPRMAALTVEAPASGLYFVRTITLF
jgi:hypothetical protein